MELKIEEVETLIKNNDKEIVLIEKSGKSDIWRHVKAIQYKNSTIKFVQCKTCIKVLPYNTKQGISNVKRHLESSACSSVNDGKQPTISNFLTKKLPSSRKTQLNERAVICLARDIRPFTTLEGSGFKILAQDLVNIGAQYGQIPVEQLFYSRKTLRTTTMENLYEKLKEGILGDIKLNLKNGVSFTTDFWTDDLKQISYLSLTAHIINDNFNLTSYLLKTINFDQQKTAENIRAFLFEAIKQLFKFSEAEFNSWKAKGQFSFVTDNGSNIVSALKNEQRLSCAGHNLNLVVDYMFKKLPENCEITKLVASCKSLVGYFKRSGLNNKLILSLKQSVVTRWNSILIMLKSVKASFEEVTHILSQQKELKRIADIDSLLLDRVIILLEPFEKATKELSCDKSPTISYVLPWYIKLRNHLDKFENEHEYESDLKDAVLLLKDGLNTKYVIKVLHKVATFLDPRMKSLKGLCSNEEKENLHQIIIDEVKSLIIPEEDVIDSTDLNPPTPKKQKLNSDLEELFDCAPQMNQQSTAEIEFYSYLNAAKVLPSQNILEFWKEVLHLYPRLGQYAKTILCIPATSTSSERVFSLAGKTLEKRRSTLKPENVDKLLFIGYNLKNKPNMFL